MRYLSEYPAVGTVRTFDIEAISVPIVYRCIQYGMFQNQQFQFPKLSLERRDG